GTISPGAKLHVEGGGTSGSDGLRITSSASGTGRANFFPYSSDRFYHQYANSADSGPASIVYFTGRNTANVGTFQFNANNNYFNGNVGIGTATPSTALDVFSGTGTTMIRGGNNYGTLNLISTSDRNYIQSANAGSSATRELYISGHSATDIPLLTLRAIRTSITGDVTIGNTISAKDFLYSSDSRLKENVAVLENSLEKVQELKGVRFNWKENGEENIGLIAQDVENVFPELVVTNSEGMKSVKYGNMVAVLIEAMKEQQAEIENQNVRIAELEQEVENLKN
ncbi:MAG: tail fiber domain-containing protein, partial [archaeon]